MPTRAGGFGQSGPWTPCLCSVRGSLVGGRRCAPGRPGTPWPREREEPPPRSGRCARVQVCPRSREGIAPWQSGRLAPGPSSGKLVRVQTRPPRTAMDGVRRLAVALWVLPPSAKLPGKAACASRSLEGSEHVLWVQHSRHGPPSGRGDGSKMDRVLCHRRGRGDKRRTGMRDPRPHPTSWDSNLLPRGV